MKKQLLTFAIVLCTMFVEAQPWNSSTDYSGTNNPNGEWSYGRKWSAQTTTFNLMTVQWGTNGWYLGNWGNGGPSIQGGPLLWPKNNGNGLPSVRWTCPYSGSFDLSALFIGNDNRGVNVVVYVALNDSLLFTGYILNYLDSIQFNLNNVLLNQNDYFDFLVEWNGGTDPESNWTQLIAIIDSVCNVTITNQPSNQSLTLGSTTMFIASSSNATATYQWQTDLGLGFQNLSNAGQYDGAQNDTLLVSNINFSNNGQLFRCIISSSSCSDTTNTAVLTIIIGINEINYFEGFNLYPNPCTDEINIVMKNAEPFEIAIYDIASRKLLDQNFISSLSLNIKEFAKGVYIYELRNITGATKKGKFVKD